MTFSGPDTLHYSDIASMSRSRRSHPSTDYERDLSPSYQRHSSCGYDHSEIIEGLEVHNRRLIKENDLLKEQVKLKEENLRLHGVQIISDVVHLLDEHHLKCNKHRAPDLSPPPIRGPTRQKLRDEVGREKHSKRPKSHSPYRQDIEEDHRLMAEMTQQRARSPNQYGDVYRKRDPSASSPKPRCRFSPSIDSIELEEALSKSVSLAAGKPKYTSTPYSYESRLDRKAGTNCNVNGNHQTPERVYDLTPPESSRSSSYFKTKNKMAPDLQNHWNRCDHKHLHVAPADPEQKLTSKKVHPSAHVRGRRAYDMNKTYIIQSKPNIIRGQMQSNTESSGFLTAGAKQPGKQGKSKRTNSRHRKLASVPEHDVTREMQGRPESERKVGHAAITKLSLLESNHTRVLGEIAFQLDKRILSFVLNGKFSRHCKYKSFYGYTVLNLQQRVIEREKGEMKEVMLDRYNFLMNSLQSAGYNIPEHSNKAVTLVNKYGVMKQTASDARSVLIGLEDEALLRGIARRICPLEEIDDVLTLLQCLAVMAADDGMPLFIW